jgi:hypothetical protein
MIHKAGVMSLGLLQMISSFSAGQCLSTMWCFAQIPIPIHESLTGWQSPYCPGIILIVKCLLDFMISTNFDSTRTFTETLVTRAMSGDDKTSDEMNDERPKE